MSKEHILKQISENKTDFIPLPDTGSLGGSDADLTGVFTLAVEAAGGAVVTDTQINLEQYINDNYGKDVQIVSNSSLFTSSIELSSIEKPHDLKSINLAVIDGSFGVAENGAVWVEEQNMGNRVLPFIAEHLILILHKKSLLANMHNAYEFLGDIKPGFGLFIAGPSKTADIEQALVIGAHGAKSLIVYLVS